VRALHFERFLDVWKAHIRDQLSLHERMAQDRHARVRQHVRHALELNKKFERKLKQLEKAKAR
jgi:phage shock protein A